MTLAMTVPIAFTVPINRDAHQIALQLSGCQFSPKRAKRVYLNILAAYATQFYLNCMDIETESCFDRPIETPELETFSSLNIVGIGLLECCPVLAGDSTVKILAETWGDRIGYIAIQFNKSLTQANLLGFLQKTTLETVEIDRLDSLETFLTYISQLEAAEKSQSIFDLTQLSKWWLDTIELGWEKLDSLVSQPQFAGQFAWRDRAISFPSTARAKVLKLDTGEQVILSLELRQIDRSELEIWVRVYPFPPDVYLPENLKLAVLDDLSIEVIQAEARTTETIQVKFIVEPGEKFGVRVDLNQVSMIESFLV